MQTNSLKNQSFDVEMLLTIVNFGAAAVRAICFTSVPNWVSSCVSGESSSNISAGTEELFGRPAPFPVPQAGNDKLLILGGCLQ